MWKKRIIGCALLAAVQLGACAHVERVGFDNTRHSLRYCGNKHADESDVESAARQECPAQRFELVSCMREQLGAKSATFDYGSGVALTHTRATYGVCCEVKCGQ